jgi:hypothetical protein
MKGVLTPPMAAAWSLASAVARLNSGDECARWRTKARQHHIAVNVVFRSIIINGLRR